MILQSSISVSDSLTYTKPLDTISGPATSWLLYLSRVTTMIMRPFCDRSCLSLRTIFPTSPTPSPSTNTPCAGTLPTTSNFSSPISRTSPVVMILTFSLGIPISTASSACLLRCLYSPWTGIAYFGLVSAYISLSSSRQAWPDTCVSSNITCAPFASSSFITLNTAFSFPGIGCELKMTTSPGFMATLLCMDAAIRDSAAMFSP